MNGRNHNAKYVCLGKNAGCPCPSEKSQRLSHICSPKYLSYMFLRHSSVMRMLGSAFKCPTWNNLQSRCGKSCVENEGSLGDLGLNLKQTQAVTEWITTLSLLNCTF